MPLYNAERFVAQALRLLLQDQSVALEVIVIDHQSRRSAVWPWYRRLGTPACG
jgi:hypothetical protein